VLQALDVPFFDLIGHRCWQQSKRRQYQGTFLHARR